MPDTSPPTPPFARLARRLVVGLLTMVVVLVAGTGVASAHASLVSTTPVDGQSVPTVPQIVSATFSESISADVGGLTVRQAPQLRLACRLRQSGQIDLQQRDLR